MEEEDYRSKKTEVMCSCFIFNVWEIDWRAKKVRSVCGFLHLSGKINWYWDQLYWFGLRVGGDCLRERKGKHGWVWKPVFHGGGERKMKRMRVLERKKRKVGWVESGPREKKIKPCLGEWNLSENKKI
jgi:hypothetical protein